MIIIREPRKPGIYAQWYEVVARRERYLIWYHHADTYEKAEAFWENRWGHLYSADEKRSFFLCNAEPYPESLALCC
jgi:hypothetical protein